MVTSFINKTMTRIFGSRNDRLIKSYRRNVEMINALEPHIRTLTDAQMRDQATDLRKRLTNGASDRELLPEAFALMRESMDRNIGLRSTLDPAQNFDPNILSLEGQRLFKDVQAQCTQEHAWRFVEIPVALYDALRAAVPSDRPPFRARPFDVQLIGGMVLYEGKIAEMATGEGKTFVAPLACFLMALRGWHCHVVTVNDYLVRRDASWVAPAFFALGLSVGYIQSFMENETRQQAYGCDVTYGTNSEFGFDFLRDNMKMSVQEQVQGPLDFTIVDEVDSILIDEARTPLIISGPAHDDSVKYTEADNVTRRLIEAQKPYDTVHKAVETAQRLVKGLEGDLKTAKGDAATTLNKQIETAKADLIKAEEALAKETQLYEIEYDRKSVHLTHEGIRLAQEYAGVGSFYVGSNMDWPHLLEQSLRAHVVYVRDKEYVVQNGEVIIVDEFTGRLMVGRQWSDGLHQAVEAKERVRVKPETQTLATITLQNFFKMYKRIAGMTGTAMTEAEEFMKIYKLDVVNIPTNRPCVRKDSEDLIYMSEKAKWNAIVETINQVSQSGQPVLVGTTSVEKSERLSNMLTRRYGIEHEVLNAKQHEREAEIVAKAGQSHVNKLGKKVGNVTIATNMAGRGTDIKLGTEVNTAGGLFVLGTERHEARRIDNQLRGRSGRQGDPGASRFYLSLEDDLMKLFSGDFMLRALQRLGVQEDEPIEHRFVSKAVERAQKKVEERNFGIRKNLLEYDEVRDVQRSYFYTRRQGILMGNNLQKIIFEIIAESVADSVNHYLDRDYVPRCIAEWAASNFGCAFDAEDLRDRDIQVLEFTIKNHAREDARSNIMTSLSEFMDPDADSEDWDYAGLAKWVLTTFSVEFSTALLRQMDREQITEELIAKAIAAIDARTIAPVSTFLEKDYALRQLGNWVDTKFDVELTTEELRGLNPDAATDLILKKANDVYRQRELTYPIDYALDLTQAGGGLDSIYASEQLVGWIRSKYSAEVTGDELRSLTPEAARARLVEISRNAPAQVAKEIDQAVDNLSDSKELASWVTNRFGVPVGPEEFANEPIAERRSRLQEMGHAFLRRELTEMERQALLYIFDATWKDHLYAMDQLRESIGLRSFAERDPRIEYKREGSRLFNEFLRLIRDKVTDLIFHVKFSSQQARNVYTSPVELHQEQTSYGVADSPAATLARAEAAGMSASEAEAQASLAASATPAANSAGRNDPCPCGSGKKYKHCCGRNAGA
jgi:preprotein translocase subunit SecA